MDREQAEILGTPTRKLRISMCFFPTPNQRPGRNDGAREVHGEARRARRLRSIPLQIRRASSCPSYHAYSIDGEIHRAPGVRELRNPREDYEVLQRMGISVSGAIVIARYGKPVARYQAEGRGRARGPRLHRLFRPQRRRLFRERRYSRWAGSASATAPSAAA